VQQLWQYADDNRYGILQMTSWEISAVYSNVFCDYMSVFARIIRVFV